MASAHGGQGGEGQRSSQRATGPASIPLTTITMIFEGSEYSDL